LAANRGSAAIAGMNRPRAAAIAGLLAVWSAACADGAAPSRREAAVYFQRYTAPDRQQLQTDIRELRQELRAARANRDRAAALRATADLGERLTTARREEEARTLLAAALAEARPLGPSETLGWLLLNLATANQYAGYRDEAGPQFAEALALAQSTRSAELEHYALHHWGRFLAEAGDIAGARDRFERALDIRKRLGDPRQASTQRALDALPAWEADFPASGDP